MFPKSSSLPNNNNSGTTTIRNGHSDGSLASTRLVGQFAGGSSVSGRISSPVFPFTAAPGSCVLSFAVSSQFSMADERRSTLKVSVVSRGQESTVWTSNRTTTAEDRTWIAYGLVSNCCMRETDAAFLWESA